jgi:hypothetical protein
MASWRSCIALGSNNVRDFLLDWVLRVLTAWTELETTAAADADDDLAHYDGFSRPRPRPTDLALVAVRPVLPYASAERVPVQHARRGSGSEKLCASGAVSADALSCRCAECGCGEIFCVVGHGSVCCFGFGTKFWCGCECECGPWGWMEQVVRPTDLSGTPGSD